jgi:hypothetical protein
MLTAKLKARIKLYRTADRTRAKANRRRSDAAETAGGNAEAVQERNRALPHASEFTFPNEEQSLPSD